VNELVFLSRDQVLELHRLSLERHGGLDGLRDPGLLDSALMQPEAAHFYGQGDHAAIAAAYAFHIAHLVSNRRLFTAGGTIPRFKRLGMPAYPGRPSNYI
jgi:hypothetical protein